MATNEMTTYISLFHNADRAEEALNALENAGFSRSAITSTWRNGAGSGASSEDEQYAAELTRIGVPSRDLKRLEEGIAQGGVVISLEAPESRTDEIERIFHKYSADKIDETDIDRGNIAAEPFVAPRLAAEPALAAEGAVVPVVEEELVVGKREVERGGVRVFRRTVEEPVTESVNLHEEHVVFERRPVDRAVTDADMRNAGQTLELTETEEIPVVSKTARVVEEVRVGKVESDRTETVHDTVRHTEVDVEPVEADTRSGVGSLPGTTKSGERY